MKIAGFDWDAGNWPKYGKHGVSQIEIEQVMSGAPACMSDPFPDEPRQRAIGRTEAGPYVFLVFVLRVVGERLRIRPISARYMHEKEVAYYERQVETYSHTAHR